MKVLKHQRVWQILAIIILVVFDLGTKLVAEANHLTVLNQGGIFGVFPGLFWPGILLLVLVFVVHEWIKTTQIAVQWGMSLILAGGIGNVWDRIAYGGVRDFIYYPMINVYGNVADIYLTIGVLWLVVVYWKSQARKEEVDSSKTK